MSTQRPAGASPLAGRNAGVLLHPSSLPGPGPQGDLGVEAKNFVNFLADCGFCYWQMLPTGPTHGLFSSPYQSLSARAGNPSLVSMEELAVAGWLTAEEISRFDRGALLDKALARVLANPGPRAEFEAFQQQHAGWLDESEAPRGIP